MLCSGPWGGPRVSAVAAGKAAVGLLSPCDVAPARSGQSKDCGTFRVFRQSVSGHNQIFPTHERNHEASRRNFDLFAFYGSRNRSRFLLFQQHAICIADVFLQLFEWLTLARQGYGGQASDM